MVHDHASEILAARVLTTDQWADYLIYTDPRAEGFRRWAQRFLRSGNRESVHPPDLRPVDWRQTMDRDNFDLALLPTEPGIVQILKLQPEWRVVVDDGKRILLTRLRTAVPPTGDSLPGPKF
jgi:hypothetical protein